MARVWYKALDFVVELVNRCVGNTLFLVDLELKDDVPTGMLVDWELKADVLIEVLVDWELKADVLI